MPTVTKQRPSVGRCDECKRDPVRLVGWSIFNNDGQGWSGGGSVRLCPDCLKAEGDALGSLPLFTEEIKAVLKARNIPYPAKATLPELVEIYTREVAPPNTEAPTPAKLMRRTVAELREVLSSPPYDVVPESIPQEATKQQIVDRIMAIHTEQAGASTPAE